MEQSRFSYDNKQKKCVFTPIQFLGLITFICLLGTLAKGYTVINDGGDHIIDYDYYAATWERDIWVDYETPSVGTDISVVDGGDIDGDLWALGDSTITVSGGRIRDTLQGTANSRITLSGGHVDDYIATQKNTVMIISGGSFGDHLWAVDNSRVYISGGNLSPLYIHENSIVTVYGSNFAINGTPVQYGQYSASDFASGTITGILTAGNTLNQNFVITGDAALVLVPEPTALSLLVLGGLLIRKRK